MRRIVVVGGSLAGVAAVEELRLLGFDGEIVLIGAESTLPYDRPPLSKGVLTGVVEPDACRLRDDGWAANFDLDLILGVAATGLRPVERSVALADETVVRFDGLVIATGASPVMLTDDRREGVHTLRTLDDALGIRASLVPGTRVTVLGAGFIGTEVAASAAARGADVTIVEALSAPLVRVVGECVGQAVAGLHSDHGVKVLTGQRVAGLEGGRSVEAVVLEDGSKIHTDLAVVGLGVRPCTEWLEGSGLTLLDGVVCDASCRTSAPGIVAAGDVARWHHPALGSIRLEHWDNAASQGQAAARALLDPKYDHPFAPVPYFWSDQFDKRFQLVGYPASEDEVVLHDGELESCDFLVLYARQGLLTGGLGVNRPRAMRPLRRMLELGASLSEATAALQQAVPANGRQS